MLSLHVLFSKTRCVVLSLPVLTRRRLLLEQHNSPTTLESSDGNTSTNVKQYIQPPKPIVQARPFIPPTTTTDKKQHQRSDRLITWMRGKTLYKSFSFSSIVSPLNLPKSFFHSPTHSFPSNSHPIVPNPKPNALLFSYTLTPSPPTDPTFTKQNFSACCTLWPNYFSVKSKMMMMMRLNAAAATLLPATFTRPYRNLRMSTRAWWWWCEGGGKRCSFIRHFNIYNHLHNRLLNILPSTTYPSFTFFLYQDDDDEDVK
jgi:hypothetical protein